MNELKPEDVMKALECWASGNPCQEECSILEHERGASCVRLTAGSALALLREKDATLEMCAETIERQDKELAQKDAEIERLTAYNANLICANTDITNRHKDYVEDAERIARAEAITEFAERLKENFELSYIIFLIDKTAKEMKGETDGESDL